MKIKKAVIPVAGKGTRFLPATKEIPKEMIPVLNQPMISLVVSEAINAGIEEIIFVTAVGKESIENHFKRNIKLEKFLQEADKNAQANEIRKLGESVKISTVIQEEQLGLGHAINCSRELVGGDSFAVLLGDDLFDGDTPGIKQLIDVFEKGDCGGVVGLFEVPNVDVTKYGVIDGEKEEDGIFKINKIVEKPAVEESPSNLAVPGRYVFKFEIFDHLDKIERGVGGEYQLTDAIQRMTEKTKVLGKILEGSRYDTGNLEGYLDATVAYAMKDKGLKKILLDAVEKYRD